MQVAEPFSDEAMAFTKELVLQREVSATFILAPISLISVVLLATACLAGFEVGHIGSHSTSNFILSPGFLECGF